MNQPQSISQAHPGGCYFGFNAAIDRKAAEQTALMFGDAARNGFREVNLLLSSTGGVLDHAYYLCAVLDALPIKIRTFNIGNVASAANLLFLCGDQRYAIEGATFFFHQTHFPPPSDQVTASFARSRAKAIGREDARSGALISGKTGRPLKTVLGWQRSELFMDTTGALANGVIHGVQAPVIPQDALFHQIVV